MEDGRTDEQTHRETQQTRTETHEKQRASTLSDRAERSEARPPLPIGPKAPTKRHAHTHTHKHTHTHAHRQTHTSTNTHATTHRLTQTRLQTNVHAHIHTSDTRRDAKRKVSSSAFWETAKRDSYCYALPVHLLRQVSKSKRFQHV